MPTQLLQTSPYLTCVWPGAAPPVVYMTDTVAPSWPDLGDPGPAAFGVIGLDRSTVWHHDLSALAALEAAAADPLPASELAERFGAELIAELTARDWLQDPADLCKEYWLRTGQIEVTAHCNWGCSYCPVSLDPKAKETMPMDLFTEIVGKLARYDSVKYVTFHFFNEPTLDVHFSERIDVLREHDTKLSLATNASALTPAKLDHLVRSGVMHHLVVNLPTVDETEFADLTGSRTYRHSLRNLDGAINSESFPITIAVNGIGEAVQRNLDELKRRYEPRGVEVVGTQTCDRAGVLDNEYDQEVRVAGRLRGCSWPLNHAYFSVRGDMFICCNDYYQREVFGHIRDGSIHEIMTSPAAVELRRKVFGVAEAPEDYLCRTCHDQKLDFPHRQFRPLATFPLQPVRGGACAASKGGCDV